jgi:hypothetical protein
MADEPEPMPRDAGVTSDAEQAYLNLTRAETKLTAAKATGDATAIAAAQTAVDSARKTADANPATADQRAHAAWVEKYGSGSQQFAPPPLPSPSADLLAFMDGNTAGMSVQTPGPWAGTGTTSAPAGRTFPEWWTSGRSSAPATTAAPLSQPTAAAPVAAPAPTPTQAEPERRNRSAIGQIVDELRALDGETVTLTLSDERLRDLARRLRDADSDYRRRNGRL